MDTNKNKLIILIGISGSGKTAFRKKYLQENPDTVVICMDEIRKEYGSVNDQTRNRLVAQIAREQLRSAIEDEHSILWDNTTLSAKYLQAVTQQKPANYKMRILYMKRSYDPVSCAESVEDEIDRKVDRSNVPKDVVFRQAERFLELISWLKISAPNEIRQNLEEIPVF